MSDYLGLPNILNGDSPFSEYRKTSNNGLLKLLHMAKNKSLRGGNYCTIHQIAGCGCSSNQDLNPSEEQQEGGNCGSPKPSEDENSLDELVGGDNNDYDEYYPKYMKYKAKYMKLLSTQSGGRSTSNYTYNPSSIKEYTPEQCAANIKLLFGSLVDR